MGEAFAVDNSLTCVECREEQKITGRREKKYHWCYRKECSIEKTQERLQTSCKKGTRKVGWWI